MSYEDQAKSLLSSANDTAKLVRGVHLTFMMVSAYIAIIISSTTDVQLLKLSPVTLPLLNVKLPIMEFYVLTPWLLLILHFNLLLQCYLLACKLHLLNAALGKCNDDVATTMRNGLFTFALSQNIVGHDHSSIMRFFLNSIIVFSIVIVPLVLLTWAQIRFIPYHDEAITWNHRIVILLDCLLLWILWPMIILPKEKLKHWLVQNLLWVKRRFGLVSSTVQAKDKISLNGMGQKSLAICSACLLFISWLVAVHPESDEKGEKANQFILTELLFNLPGKPFRQDIYITDKVLVKGEPSAKVEVALKGDNDVDKLAALREVVGLSLAGRDLRFAVFEKCVMPKAMFGSAHLQGAVFNDSSLHGANFLSADLRGAKMIRSQLSGSILNDANMRGVQLLYANLQTADLDDAKLQGAVLISANMIDTKMRGSQLQGAILNSAKMVGADLSGARFEGASMLGADLARATLDKDQAALIKSMVLGTQ